MIHHFLTYTQSKKFKDLGFNEECFAYYETNSLDDDSPKLIMYVNQWWNRWKKISDRTGERRFEEPITNKNLPQFGTAAPLIQQAIMWLQTKGLFIELVCDGWWEGNDENIGNHLAYRAFIYELNKPKPKPADDIGCMAYLNISLYAIDQCIERLKERK